MSNQATSTDLRNVTFSQGLEGGLTHSDWLASPMKDQFGQDRVLAKPCQSQEQGAESKIQSDTFGPLFDTSSPTPSADLCASLESKLRADLDVNGSPEYDLTWRQWDMPQGPQICALRASARRTSGSDCGGWPTVSANEDAAGTLNGEMQFMLSHAALTANPTAEGKQLTTPEQSGGPAATEKQGEYLPDGSQTAGWVTPRANAYASRPNKKGGITPEGQAQTAGWQSPKASDSKSPGKSRDVHLKHQAETAGWGTPTEQNSKQGEFLPDGAQTAGWQTPDAYNDPKSGGSKPGQDSYGKSHKQLHLHHQAETAGYPTARCQNTRETKPRQDEDGNWTDRGNLEETTEVFRLPNMAGWKLNPAFSGWLMGYPKAWMEAGLRAMQNCSRSRKASKGVSDCSKATETQSTRKSRRSS